MVGRAHRCIPKGDAPAAPKRKPKYRDPDARREYMRKLMKERRAKGKQP